MNTFVLTTDAKTCLTTRVIDMPGLTIFRNPKWNLPTGHFRWQHLNKYNDGDFNEPSYNCWRGHQEICKLVTEEFALVFEDDCMPNVPEWLKIVKDASVLLKDYEVVSLHLRDWWAVESFEHEGKMYGVPGEQEGKYRRGLRWGVGSLAYLISREAAHRFGGAEWRGLPFDLELLNYFKCCAIFESPFLHDRRFGSLIDKSCVSSA